MLVFFLSIMSDEPDDSKENGNERNLGTQPLDAVLLELDIGNHDVVAAFGKPGLTHKALQRARKGRKLTPHMKVRITESLNSLLRNRAVDRHFGVRDLFNY